MSVLPSHATAPTGALEEFFWCILIEVSQNGSSPKSSIFCLILLGFSITNHPSGYPPISGICIQSIPVIFSPKSLNSGELTQVMIPLLPGPQVPSWYPAPIRPQREFLQGSRSGTRRSNSPTKRLSEGSLVLGKFKAHVRSKMNTSGKFGTLLVQKIIENPHNCCHHGCHMPSSRCPNPCWRPSKSFGPGTLALNHTQPYQVRPPRYVCCFFFFKKKHVY